MNRSLCGLAHGAENTFVAIHVSVHEDNVFNLLKSGQALALVVGKGTFFATGSIMTI
jgi:hypothetical protein